MSISEEKRDEAIEQLNDAESRLREAIDLISSAVEDTSEEDRAHSYIIPHLHSWIDDRSQIASIVSMIENIEEEETFEEGGG